MTDNRENWLYPHASGLYFPHDGFIMRATDGKQYDYEEQCELLNEYHNEYNECRNDVLRLEKENEQLKNRLKDWHQRTYRAYEYFDILEKVIDEVCDDDISNQIWKEYEKREKLVE